MSVKKFKTFEEAREALWVTNPDDEYFEKLRKIFFAVQRLSPRKVKRGIQKFKSIVDANNN